LPKQLIYLEDLHVGRRFLSGRYEMDEKRMKEFAAEIRSRFTWTKPPAQKASSKVWQRAVGIPRRLP